MSEKKKINSSSTIISSITALVMSLIITITVIIINVHQVNVGDVYIVNLNSSDQYDFNNPFDTTAVATASYEITNVKNGYCEYKKTISQCSYKEYAYELVTTIHSGKCSDVLKAFTLVPTKHITIKYEPTLYNLCGRDLSTFMQNELSTYTETGKFH